MRDFIREMWPVLVIVGLMALSVGSMVYATNRDIARCKAAGGQLFRGVEISGDACIAVPFARIERW